MEFWTYVSYYTTSSVHFWFGPSWGVYIPGVAPSAWFQPRSIALPRLKSMILLFSSRATKFPSNLQSFPNPHVKGSLVSLLITWFPKSVVYLKENYLRRRSSITKKTRITLIFGSSPITIYNLPQLSSAGFILSLHAACSIFTSKYRPTIELTDYSEVGTVYIR